MTWVKLDDRFAEHPKLAAVGPMGWGMWAAGIAYANRQLTDGFIPDAVAEGIGGMWRTRQGGRVWHMMVVCEADKVGVTSEWVACALVEAGLWHRVEGGYQIHDFDKYQPKRATVLAERERISGIRRDAGSSGGKQTSSKRAANGVANAQQKSSPVPVPVPVVAEVVADPSPAPASTREPQATAAGGREDSDSLDRLGECITAWLRTQATPQGGMGPGLTGSSAMRDAIVVLLKGHGPERVLWAIQAAADKTNRGAPNIGFLRKLCTEGPLPERSPTACGSNDGRPDHAGAVPFDMRVHAPLTTPEQTPEQMARIRKAFADGLASLNEST